jgi:hypothetical protein
MQNASRTTDHNESYVVEIDGKIQSRYQIYVDAIKAGMKLKQKFPSSKIKVHDVKIERTLLG